MATHTEGSKSKWKEVEKLAVEVALQPEVFVGGDENLAERLAQATKQLFDLGRHYEDDKAREHGGPLSTFELEGFEADQLWEQLALHHTPMLRYLRRQAYDLAARAEKRPRSFFPFMEEEESGEAQDEGEGESGEDANGGDMQEPDEAQSDQDENGIEMDEDIDEDEGDDQHDDDNQDAEEDENEQEEEEGADGAEEGDRFFNMDDMERFIEQAEEEAERERDGEEEEEGSDDDEDEEEEGDEDLDELDMVDEEDDEDGLDMDSETEGLNGGKQLGGGIKYDQFFDAPEAKQKKKLEEKIRALEDKIVGSKPWQMRGEIGDRKRPLNSLLEEHLEFESAIRQAPVITEEVTMALEDIIKKRIIEGSFDDVVRREEDEVAPRKALPELDFQKSQKSLAELYEEEYIKSVEKANAPTANRPVEEKKTKQQEEVLRRYAHLAYKLDALSNFHFTPKPVLPDMVVKENVAAIRMEEIIPVGVSDATLLAPQEVFSPDKRDSALPTSDTKSKKKRMRKKRGKSKPGSGMPKGQNISRLESTKGEGAMTSTKLFKQLTQEAQQTVKGKASRQPVPAAPSRKDTGLKL